MIAETTTSIPCEPAPATEAAAGVRLTPMESALLRRLRENPGKCLSRQFLLENIWGYRKGVRSRTLDVHIRRLRAKLGPEGRAHIKTFFRDGYCWYPER